MDRQAVLFGRLYQNAAARGAVELGHHQPGNTRHFLEYVDLAERVLAIGGVEHQHHVVGRFRVQAPEDFADLCQFVHQFALVLQPAGRVDDQRIGTDIGRLLDRVEHDARRIAAFGTAHDRHTDAIRPGRQLADRGGTERITRGQHHGVIVFLEQVGELGDSGGLAAAIDPDDQQHLRPRECGDLERLRHGPQDRGDLFRDRFLQLALGDLETETLLRQLRADPRGGRRAEIGQDQRILDIVERGIVELGGADHFGEIAGQFLGSLAKTPEQPVGPALLVGHSRRPFSCLDGVTVTMVPGTVPSGRPQRAKCGV